MSKRTLQIAGALLMLMTVGIVSCQALFAGEPEAQPVHAAGERSGR
jgi:hypothetical protein